MSYPDQTPEKLWHHFPLWSSRPTDVHTYDESERTQLELAVALHLSTILSYYAHIEDVELDINTNIEEEILDSDIQLQLTGEEFRSNDTRLFTMLALDPIALEDDGDLLFGQLPFDGHDYQTASGAYSIAKLNADGVLELEFTVWDESIETDTRVHFPNGEHIDIDLLQELYEALVESLKIIASTDDPNDPPLETAEYPIQVIEPDFLAIIVQAFPE